MIHRKTTGSIMSAIDPEGRIRAVEVGEIHEGDPVARRLEAQIDALLTEP